MKWSAAVASLAVASSLSILPESAHAFRPATQQQLSNSAFVPHRFAASTTRGNNNIINNNMPIRAPPTQLSMTYQVGIVGATGAVGKEIRQCLENRDFPVSKLRIFGSSRSAGSQVDTKFGKVTVELFDVAAARECDVVFLAVSGDFALEHARALSEGDDGCVCIDNSVSVVSYRIGYLHCELNIGDLVGF